MALMKINTKVIFEWSSSLGRYEEVYCESYNYDGEVAKCQDNVPGEGGTDEGYEHDATSTINTSKLVKTENNETGNVTSYDFPSATTMVAADEEIPRWNAGIKEAPMHLREVINDEVEAGAQLFIQNKITGSIKAQTAKFYLTAMSIPASEKTQLLETFGNSVVSFFGQNAKVYNFGGTCVDWASSTDGDSGRYFHQSSLIKLYNDLMRGTRLVEHGNIAILKILNHTVYGYPLNLQVQYQAQLDKMANFTMSWLVSEHTLGLNGVVTESDLTAMHTFGSTIRLDLMAKITAIESVLTPLYNLLEFANYTDPVFNSISSLGWKSISAPDIINFFPDEASKTKFKEVTKEKIGSASDALLESIKGSDFPVLLNTIFLTTDNQNLEGQLKAWSVGFKSNVETFWNSEKVFDYKSFETVKLATNQAYTVLKTLLKWRLQQRTIAAGVSDEF